MRTIMIFILAFTLPAFPKDDLRVNTSKISDFQKQLESSLKKHKASEILVIYDIDNTLLAPDSDLGSDPWFSWQTDLLNKDSADRIAQDFESLLRIQGKIMFLGSMHTVETDTSKVVNRIQSLGVSSLILTSRGPNFRSDTEIDLAQAKIDITQSAPGPKGGFTERLYPDNIVNPRAISYQNGIMMGNGQNKGKILRYLLKRTSRTFKAILFLDDTLKNIEHVEDEFREDHELYTFYYTHEESRVKRFELDKERSKAEWKAFVQALRMLNIDPSDFYKKN